MKSLLLEDKRASPFIFSFVDQMPYGRHVFGIDALANF